MKSFLLNIQRGIYTYRLPLLSGILQATSYIPFPPWALFFCFIPLWIFWTQSDLKKTIYGTLVCAFVASFIGFHWIAITVHDFGKMPWIVALLALSGYSLIANIYLVIAALLWGALRPYLNQKIHLLLIPWLSTFCMLYTPMLFPWHYGYAWIYGQFPAAQISDLFGISFLCTLTFLLNSIFFFAVYTKKYKHFITLGFILFLFLNVLGFVRLKLLPEETQHIKALLVQGNIGNLQKQETLYKGFFREETLKKFMQLTYQALDQERLKNSSGQHEVDLVVWPETSYPFLIEFDNFRGSAPQLYKLTHDQSVNLITGFYDYKSQTSAANAVLYVNALGSVAAPPTHKSILLAFGEYLPGAETFPILRKIIPTAEFIRGPGPEKRELAGLSYGPLVCYEALFSDYSRQLSNQDIHMFVNLTNDSWYDDVFEPNQHMYITAGRALENRRPVLRATNTGITTVIDSKGQVMSVSPRSQEWTGVYKVGYPEKTYKTPFQKWGKPFHEFFLFFVVAMLIFWGRMRFLNE